VAKELLIFRDGIEKSIFFDDFAKFFILALLKGVCSFVVI
jgi:hypothetical protein